MVSGYHMLPTHCSPGCVDVSSLPLYSIWSLIIESVWTLLMVDQEQGMLVIYLSYMLHCEVWATSQSIFNKDCSVEKKTSLHGVKHIVAETKWSSTCRQCIEVLIFLNENCSILITFNNYLGIHLINVGLYGLYGPRCPLSPKRLLTLISHSHDLIKATWLCVLVYVSG